MRFQFVAIVALIGVPVLAAARPNVLFIAIDDLRTATQRYTRWVTWPVRQLIAEELYDYNTGPSARRDGELWIEQQNLATKPARAALRSDLSQKLDQMLAQRITVRHDLESTPTKKRKNKQP